MELATVTGLSDHLAQHHGLTTVFQSGFRMHLAAMQHTHQKMHQQGHFGCDALQRSNPPHREEEK